MPRLPGTGGWNPYTGKFDGGRLPGLAGVSPLAALAFLGRLALRLLPWVGLALTAYLLWQWYRQGNKPWGANGGTRCLDDAVDRYAPYADLNCRSNQGTQAWLSYGQTTNADYIAGYRFQPIVGGDWDVVEIWPNENRYTGKPLQSPGSDIETVPPVVQPVAPNPWMVPQPYWPTIDPEGAPIAQPWPLPQPLPPAYAPLQPDWSPHAPPGQPVREEPFWPSPEAPTWPWPDQGWPGWPQPQPPAQVDPGTAEPQPEPQPEPTPTPWPLPPPEFPIPGPPPVPPAVSFSPGRPRRMVPPRNKPGKPPSRTRERKFIAGPHARRWLGIALNIATESGDVINAFWWALPKECRTPPTRHPDGYWVAASLTQKAIDVYRCAPEVDGEKALKNFIANQIGDFIGGKTGKATAKANRKMWESGLSPNNGFSLGRGPAL